MKLALAVVVALLAAPRAFAGDGADLVYLQPGATQEVAIPFAIGGTTLSNPRAARVHAHDRMIDVVGVAEGKTKVVVTEARHPEHAYTVYVIVSKQVHD